MAKTLVIAEPGCTHEGSKDTLVRLLETAHDCGADVFKPQWCSDPALMCERRHIVVRRQAEYINADPTDEDSYDPTGERGYAEAIRKRAYYERAYGWLAFPFGWHVELANMCHALGMQYACSVYLPQDVAHLAPLVDYFKISSFEAQDDALRAEWLRASGAVFVSTGMLDDDQIKRSRWGDAGLLLCTSSYPAPSNALNLAALHSGIFAGYSDHSRDLRVGMVAVAAGAYTVETHYRLADCDPDNPDYAVAFTPAEFAQYIKNIRDVETMMGDGIKRRQACEEWAIPFRVTS